MRFAAVIRISEQCSPDDFEWRTYIKEVSPETTIGDLFRWQKTRFKHRGDIQRGAYFHEMTIQEME